MQKHSQMEIASLIVFLSIITTVLQFTAYYLLSSEYVILAITCVLSIISIHILQEYTLSYESCFIYTLLTLFIAFVITLLLYLGRGQSHIPYNDVLLWMLVANWGMPTAHCFIRSMFNYGTRIEHFPAFYRNINIIFLIFYLGVLIYSSFFERAFPWAYTAIMEKPNYIPFYTLATQIEDYIHHLIPFADILNYLLYRILIYIPYGFFVALMLRRRPRIVRFACLFILPVIIEIIQYIIIPTRCDIDDLIYSIVGGLFGVIGFLLINFIYRMINGSNFLARESDSYYSKSSLHF